MVKKTTLNPQKSSSVATQGSQELNELMLRYAQLNNLKGVVGCLRKGANANYKQESLLEIAVYMGHYSIVKLGLNVCDCTQLSKLLTLSSTLGHKRVAKLLQNHMLENPDLEDL